MCIRDSLHLARPVGIDQAAGSGRAADADDQNKGDDAQKAQAQAAAAAAWLLALGRQVSGDVLDGLLVGLHKNLREEPQISQITQIKTSKTDGVSSARL